MPERPSSSHIKIELNSLLLALLPGSCTLEEFDNLGCQMLEQIEAVWDRLTETTIEDRKL
jgi:hypothetical protein